MSESLAFETKELGKWGYCLNHLLAMHFSPKPIPRITLFFSAEYVVIQAENLPRLWQSLVARDASLSQDATASLISSIKKPFYEPDDDTAQTNG